MPGKLKSKGNHTSIIEEQSHLLTPHMKLVKAKADEKILARMLRALNGTVIH